MTYELHIEIFEKEFEDKSEFFALMERVSVKLCTLPLHLQRDLSLNDFRKKIWSEVDSYALKN